MGPPFFFYYVVPSSLTVCRLHHLQFTPKNCISTCCKPTNGNSSIHLALRTLAIRIVDLRWIACNLVLSANMLIVFLFILVVSGGLSWISFFYHVLLALQIMHMSGTPSVPQYRDVKHSNARDSKELK